jgi:hypothetical protein
VTVRRADNAAFFLGMLRWLQTQLGEQYFCRWRIHQHEFIESRDPEFMLDALRCALPSRGHVRAIEGNRELGRGGWTN